MRLRNLRDFNFKGKTALVRAGFDCPLDKKGNILDDTRIKAVIPTLKYLVKKKAKIVIISHNGRPQGNIILRLTMDKTAQRLAKLMKKHIAKHDDCIGNEVAQYIDDMVPGEIVVLENLRFYDEEKENNRHFARFLSEPADIYVNDSFPTCHDKDTSMIGIPRLIPGCIGLALQEELKAMQKPAKAPKKPYIAIIGGKKANKIDSVRNIMKKADNIFVVGVLANTFLKAEGINIGNSAYDKKSLKKAKMLLKSKKIIIPTDFIVKIGNKTKIVDYDNISKDAQTMDIGPKTLEMYRQMISKAKTVLWAGPPGVFEDRRFAKGTEELAKMLSKSKATTIVGGGDTGEAVCKLKLAKKMTHVSTGGGASLALFEGKMLPALKALEDNHKKFKKIS
jgi:phosphoglycerate kinase